MSATNFIQAMHHLKVSKEFFQDIQRDCVGTKGATIAKKYEDKIEWMYKDLLTNPNFNEDFRKGLKEEWSADAFVVPALMEKITELTPENREKLEVVVQAIIDGEEITIELKSK